LGEETQITEDNNLTSNMLAVLAAKEICSLLSILVFPLGQEPSCQDWIPVIEGLEKNWECWKGEDSVTKREDHSS